MGGSPGGRPRVGVLALQGDVREHLRALEAAGAKATTVRRPVELAAIDGLVIPGGESTTMWRLATTFGLLEPLRSLVADGLPTFGSCAGMIMLADRIADGAPGQQTLGGLDVTVRRNAFGRQVDSFETELSVVGVPGGPVHAVFIRAPWVEAVGPSVEVLARVPSGGGPRSDSGGSSAGDSLGKDAAGRIVAVRQGPTLATSFHPELTGDHRLHRLFVDLIRSGAVDPAGPREDGVATQLQEAR